jgi:hypothetical protein
MNIRWPIQSRWPAHLARLQWAAVAAPSHVTPAFTRGWRPQQPPRAWWAR